MKTIFLFVTLCMSSAAALASDLSTYITDGSRTTASAYPDYVTLFYYREYSTGYVYGMYCGGTMIDATHVLTAAHCVTDDDSEPNEEYILYTVVAQVDTLSDFPNNATYVQAESVYYPDDYQYSSTNLWPNDIAVVKLASSLNIGHYANLPSQGYEDYRGTADTFIAVGHGKTSTNSTTSNYLLSAEMDYVSNSVCATDLANIHDTQLCFAGISSGSSSSLTTGVCSGDSGGPIYDTTESRLQIGVTSFGPSTCGVGLTNSGVTGVFTEVADYADWIANVVNGSVTAKYTATEAKRSAYSSSSSSSSSDDDSTVSTTSSSGGGSVGLISLMWLSLFGLARFMPRILR
ncbi:S1 family peptidase [Vibrio porteresiae]|uniref:Serine protease n=1 Tax=Vibrio porteresiae DSM 19223 TaxID=1123496 RepID=A0ABZ0QHH0_9VIBR|nr:serine protease [Vibrio porteresiae]WPC75943.1 serine protease [Vibrio porteresiae DSM 19223]